MDDSFSPSLNSFSGRLPVCYPTALPHQVSGSSAIPAHSEHPVLSASVHRCMILPRTASLCGSAADPTNSAISPAKAAGLTDADLSYRVLRPSDFDQIEQLHREWFPVKYHETFFSMVCRGDVFGFGAVFKDDLIGDEHVAGLITVTQKPGRYVQPQDIFHVLGQEAADHVAFLAEQRKEMVVVPEEDSSPPPIHPYQMNPEIHVAYILTLGVADGFRGIGLATRLLRETLNFFVSKDPQFTALYLHVAEYNTAAIGMYRRFGFQQVHRYEDFYRIQGESVASLLYVYYVKPLIRPSLSIRWRRKLMDWLGISMQKAA